MMGMDVDRFQGGLGIGLALVQHLLELASGSAYSEGPGCASALAIRLPANRSGVLHEDPAPPAAADDRRQHGYGRNAGLDPVVKPVDGARLTGQLDGRT
jgi:hypothetical protein